MLAFGLSQPLAAQTVERTVGGVRLGVEGGKLKCEVTFYSPSIVRVVKAPQASMPAEESLAVVMSPGETKLKVAETDGAVTLASREVSVTVDRNDGTVTFADARGNSLLKEQGAPVFTPIESGVDKGFYRVSQAFRLDKDEPIYGLGQLQTGKMSQRDQQKYLIQSNLEDSSPFFQSVKGYGLYLDNYSPVTFTDNADGTRFDFEVGSCVDYYFMYGGTADGVVARVRELTG